MSELRAMLRLAWPVVVAELGWVLMGIVDTIFVGPLGAAAIGAVGTGSTMFFAVMVLGLGTLYALDTFVSQSAGAGRFAECHRWLFAGIQLAVVMSVVLVVLGVVLVSALPAMGLHPDVIVLLDPYLGALFWSAPPLLVLAVFRRYLQAMGAVKPIALAVLLANVVNAFGNWIFVYGHLGMPALGAVGSAYATLVARIVLAVHLWIILVRRERRVSSGLRDVPFVLDGPRMRRLLVLGLPAAVQLTLEVGVFAAASALAGRISPVALAANQIVLNVASFFFMIPLGLSAAAAVRVGYAIGRGDPDGARRAGWSALGLGLAFAFVVITLFVLVPIPIVRLFTNDTAVLGAGITVLMLCAVFQPFDAFQVIATGALRGAGSTRTPMAFNLVGHWLIGLPVAYYLCFTQEWGVAGLWAGLSFGIILIGSGLVLVWRWRSRHLAPVS